MKRRRKARALSSRPLWMLIVLTVLVQACTLLPSETPRPRYYVLSPAPLPRANQSRSHGAAEKSAKPVNVIVGPVEIPAYLDRTEIVMTGRNNDLMVSSFHRWAEPLEQAIERVIAINLAAGSEGKLACYPFYMNAPLDNGTPALRLSINVLRFHKQKHGSCRLDARYFLTDLNGKKLLLQNEIKLTSNARSNTFADAVACQNKLLNDFSTILLEQLEEAASIRGRLPAAVSRKHE